MLVLITARTSGSLSGVSARLAEMPQKVVDGIFGLAVVALVGLTVLAVS